MKFFGGMDLPSSRIVVESLTTFFDAAVVCCAFVIEAVVGTDEKSHGGSCKKDSSLSSIQLKLFFERSYY